MFTKITSSSELMSNFKQVATMAPERAFSAVQTADGKSLLFSIGTDGMLYAVGETSGVDDGWDRLNLSGGIAAGYPAGTASVKRMAVAQNTGAGSIDLVLVMTANGVDDVYLCLGNSASDTGWLGDPAWVKAPFDDKAHPSLRVVVQNVFVSETSDGQYIAVDVLRDPSNPTPLILRYFLDPGKTISGSVWNAFDVAVDLDASSVRSCLGRRKDDPVDGLYTLGTTAGNNTLVFQPLYDAFDPRVPANPVRLVLPGGVVGSALASSAGTDNTTGLFVSAGRTLYYFPPDGQADHSTAIPILTNPLFLDTQRLVAFTDATKTVVWGLNRANQIFYSACTGKAADPAAWSTPLPICSGVQQFSPYVNRASEGNTFFVQIGTDRLLKATQSPATTTWAFDEILLPAAPTAKAQKFNSYTTRIQIADDANAPIPNSVVRLAAVSRAGVFVNGLYYVLDVTPIPITTDRLGALVVVEWVDALAATTLVIHRDDGRTVSINPMDKAFQKAAALNTADALQAAVVTNGDGSTAPLVKPGTSPADLQTVARTLGVLADVYKTLPSNGAVAMRPQLFARPSAAHLEVVASFAVGASPAHKANGAAARMVADVAFDSWIGVAAGDLLEWLKSAASYTVNIVKDSLSGAWHFVANIAGKAYSFVYDTIQTVVASLEIVFKAVATAIQTLIDYLKFLFDWQDMVRTKDVMKKILLFSADIALDGLAGVKADFNGVIASAKAEVDAWANVKADSWQPSVTNTGRGLGFLESTMDVAKVLTSPAMFLQSHLTANMGRATGGTGGSATVAQQILDRALAAVEDQAGVLVDAADRIQSELIDNSQYASLSLDDILKKITAIVVDALLNSTETVVDAVIDVLVALGRAVIDLLDKPIWIPVVSDILQDVFNITIDFSLLDAIVMAAAVPATIGYKALLGTAPFPAGDTFASKVLAATSLSDLAARFQTPQNAPALVTTGNTDPPVPEWVPIELTEPERRTAFLVGHLLSGIGALLSTVIVVPSLLRDDSISQQYETAVAICGVVSGAGTAVATLFEAKLPIQNAHIARLNMAATALTLIGKLGFAAAPYLMASGGAPSPELSTQCKKIGAGFDAVFALLGMTATCYHFYELSGVPASVDRTEAFLDETGSLCAQLSRIATFGVRMDSDPVSKAILAVIMAALTGLYGGFQIAEAIAAASGTKPSERRVLAPA